MKKLIVTLMICGLTICCNKSNNRIETDLYNCMIDSLTEEEKEKTLKIFKEYEEHLVEKGILESRESISYWKFYKNIADTGTYDFTNNFNFFEKTEFLEIADPADNDYMYDCYNHLLQTEKYKQSRFFQFSKEMESLKKHKITPVIMAKITIKHLRKEDFELDYYRFLTLGFIEKNKI